LASKSSNKKSISYFLGLGNLVIALIWGLVYFLVKEVAANIFSSSSMLLYVATFFLVAMGLVIVPTLEKDSGKKGVNVGVLCSLIAALLYGGYAAMHYTNNYDTVRRMIFPNG